MKTIDTGVDWDDIDRIINTTQSVIPPNGVTTKMIRDKYGVGYSSGDRMLRKMADSGKYEIVKYRKDGRVVNVAVPVEPSIDNAPMSGRKGGEL